MVPGVLNIGTTNGASGTPGDLPEYVALRLRRGHRRRRRTLSPTLVGITMDKQSNKQTGYGGAGNTNAWSQVTADGAAELTPEQWTAISVYYAAQKKTADTYYGSTTTRGDDRQKKKTSEGCSMREPYGGMYGTSATANSHGRSSNQGGYNTSTSYYGGRDVSQQKPSERYNTGIVASSYGARKSYGHSDTSYGGGSSVNSHSVPASGGIKQSSRNKRPFEEAERHGRVNSPYGTALYATNMLHGETKMPASFMQSSSMPFGAAKSFNSSAQFSGNTFYEPPSKGAVSKVGFYGADRQKPMRDDSEDDHEMLPRRRVGTGFERWNRAQDDLSGPPERSIVKGASMTDEGYVRSNISWDEFERRNEERREPWEKIDARNREPWKTQNHNPPGTAASWRSRDPPFDRGSSQEAFGKEIADSPQRKRDRSFDRSSWHQKDVPFGTEDSRSSWNTYGTSYDRDESELQSRNRGASDRGSWNDPGDLHGREKRQYGKRQAVEEQRTALFKRRGMEEERISVWNKQGLDKGKLTPLKRLGVDEETMPTWRKQLEEERVPTWKRRAMGEESIPPLRKGGLDEDRMPAWKERSMEDDRMPSFNQRDMKEEAMSPWKKRVVDEEELPPWKIRAMEEESILPLRISSLDEDRMPLWKDRSIEDDRMPPSNQRDMEDKAMSPWKKQVVDEEKLPPWKKRAIEEGRMPPTRTQAVEDDKIPPWKKRRMEEEMLLPWKRQIQETIPSGIRFIGGEVPCLTRQIMGEMHEAEEPNPWWKKQAEERRRFSPPRGNRQKEPSWGRKTEQIISPPTKPGGRNAPTLDKPTGRAVPKKKSKAAVKKRLRKIQKGTKQEKTIEGKRKKKRRNDSDEDPPPDIPDGIAMMVCDKRYPTVCMKEYQSKIIVDCLLKAIENLADDESPQFSAHRFMMSGMLSIICANQHTCSWLKKVVESLKGPWKGADLTARPFRAPMVIHIPGPEEPERVVKEELQKANRYLEVHEWELMKKEVLKLRVEYTYLIDNSSFEALQVMQFRPCYKNTRVFVKMLHAAYKQETTNVAKKPVANVEKKGIEQTETEILLKKATAEMTKRPVDNVKNKSADLTEIELSETELLLKMASQMNGKEDEEMKTDEELSEAELLLRQIEQGEGF